MVCLTVHLLAACWLKLTFIYQCLRIYSFHSLVKFIENLDNTILQMLLSKPRTQHNRPILSSVCSSKFFSFFPHALKFLSSWYCNTDNLLIKQTTAIYFAHLKYRNALQMCACTTISAFSATVWFFPPSLQLICTFTKVTKNACTYQTYIVDIILHI